MAPDDAPRLLVLQAGALLGPMTGTGVATLVPALSEVYAVGTGAAALSITAYMAPFAVAQLASGSIAQLLTGRRTALLGFVVFAGASLACAAAPTFTLFLLFRLLQGLGAAFLFPILMALVGEVVPAERLGRAMGSFGATQTLGLALGPLLAGLWEAYLDWRGFFVMLGAAAAAAGGAFLGCFAAVEQPVPRDERRLLALVAGVLREPAVILLSLAAAAIFMAMIGTYTYLAVWLKAGPGLAEDRIGAVLAVAGAVGIPASAVAGRWVDRYGRKPVGLAGLATHATALLGLALVPYSFAGTVLLATWFGWTAATAWTALNTLAVEILPDLRKPVASVYNAFRFSGYALAPPLLGLAYVRGGAGLVFVTAAAVVLVAAALLACLRVPRRAPR